MGLIGPGGLFKRGTYSKIDGSFFFQYKNKLTAAKCQKRVKVSSKKQTIRNKDRGMIILF